MRKLFIITALLFIAGTAFGQTLQKGTVVSIHTWTVKLHPDVTMNQFLKMWENDFKPIFTKALPEMKPFVIKGIQDHNKFEYAGLYVWDSVDELRKFFNEDGSPTEAGAVATEPLMNFMSEIQKYGEFSYTAGDYMIIQ